MNKRDILQFYFSFKGRATRYDFNVRYLLIAFVGGMIAFGLDYLIWKDAVFAPQAKTYFYNGWTFIMFIAGLCVTARRLHDMNYSGWWQAVIYFFPAVLLGTVVMVMGATIIVDPLASGITGIVTMIILFVFYCLYFIFLSIKRGTIGPNTYGDDPLQTETFIEPQTTETLS
jgi:uncharacterized membrane protein YhaH (DUF805 family)